MRLSGAVILVALVLLACGAQGEGGIDARRGDPDTADDSTAEADPPIDLAGPRTFATWPGNSTVTTVSVRDAFGPNLSGLVYEPASPTASAILWGVQNEPAKLHRLTWDGATFMPVTGDGWTTGKALRYPGGNGSPDSEGMTRTEWTSAEIYIVAERDNDAKDTSRQSILRYQLGGTLGLIEATHEWNVTGDLPIAEPNHGLEGIAWIPDSYLIERGFFDESKQSTYDPAAYANHGTGIFLVGYDVTGTIYGYVLDHMAGTFTRVTSFGSGQAGTMDLSFDREEGLLWSLCDNACDNRMTLLELDGGADSTTRGHFVLRATLAPPKSLQDLNSEGVTLAPETECAGGQRAIFWSDDDESGGYAIRRAGITCGRLF